MSAFLLKHRLPAPTCLSIPVATAAESDKQRGSPDGIGRSILQFTSEIHTGELHLKESFCSGCSAGFTLINALSDTATCCWTSLIGRSQLMAPDRNDHDSSPTRKPCNYVKHFHFNQVPASFCGLYSRYRSWCITKNVQSCGMPLMYIVIYPEYVTRTKAIVHCCIFSVLTGLWYRWDIVWYRI